MRDGRETNNLKWKKAFKKNCTSPPPGERCNSPPTPPVRLNTAPGAVFKQGGVGGAMLLLTDPPGRRTFQFQFFFQ